MAPNTKVATRSAGGSRWRMRRACSAKSTHGSVAGKSQRRVVSTEPRRLRYRGVLGERSFPVTDAEVQADVQGAGEAEADARAGFLVERRVHDLLLLGRRQHRVLRWERHLVSLEKEDLRVEVDAQRNV